MNETCYKRDTCRLCGGTALELVLPLSPTPLGDAFVPKEQLRKAQAAYPLELYLCRDCGLPQLLHVVRPELIYIDYIYQTSVSLGLPEHFQRYVDETLDFLNPPAGTFVVEIGSNDGTLLEAFQDRGMRVLGIDPAHEIAQKATERGVETLPVFFNKKVARAIRNERGLAGIIAANNVMANIDDLDGFVAGIHDLLMPDGIYVFETGYMADLVPNMVFDFIYHEHLSYFLVKPLQFFFHCHGMKIIDAKRVATKGGSLRCMVQLEGGPRRVLPTVAEVTDYEESTGIGRPETLKDFANKIDAVKKELLSVLHDLKQRGKVIAGYGASHSVTTMLHHFDLGDKVEFVLDDNPIKHHTFSPGHHIPVLPPQALYERKPDYVLILAWRYAQPIMNKHQTFLEQGGHFIVPLPKVEVI